VGLAFGIALALPVALIAEGWDFVAGVGLRILENHIFNALTAAGAEVASYRCDQLQTLASSRPRSRLKNLAKLIHPQKVTPTVLEFFDIAGLVKGASQGEGLGNQFLDHIRNVDAIAHTVRCFKNENVAHDFGSVDAVRDIEVINIELILADLQTLEKRMAKVEKLHRVGAKEASMELEIYHEAEKVLNQGSRADTLHLTGERRKHRVPLADTLRKHFNVSLVPIV
jgi:ribosome-binding ATPase YchF (GTP1/OBG family)